MKVGVLGAGAYGLALTHILVNNKVEVTMWTHDENERKTLDETRKSKKLNDYKIPNEIKFTCDLNEAVNNKDLIVMAIPAFAFEDVTIKLSKYIKKKQPVLIATKGIQQNTCLFLNDVFAKYLKNGIAVISGPTFAVDIIKDSPVGFSLATKNNKTEMVVRKCFQNSTTKFRRTKDIVGIEICGSIKNVMAIASGMLEGMGVTDSTRALFLTESMNDIKELIDALGGKKKSILSFAGFGDILMTCTSKNSRNFSFGYLIGSGATNEEVNKYLETTTVEGMYTLKSIHKLVRRKKVKMPIINLIHDIIEGKKDKEEMLKFLINKVAIKFQYNKTSLQQLEKQLKMRERSLPTIKSKESALRIEVKRTKDEVTKLELQLEQEIQSYENMMALWNEFNPELIAVRDVSLSTKKIAGVVVPVLDEIEFEIGRYSLFNAPAWFTDGIELLKKLARTGIEAEFSGMKLELLEHARKKTTQKVNLFEKVQIPGYKDAIRKVKRFMEDEESLSKSSQKIMRANQEKRKAKEEKEEADV